MISLKHIMNYILATVWFVNGLYCKLLHQAPRHEMIVARILHTSAAPLLTKLIGIAEIGMSLWILSGYKRRLNIITQIVIIAIMNLLEFILAPDLLLWGRLNALFAFLLILCIGLNGSFLMSLNAKKY
jgi:hypothetical protein